MTLLIEEPGSCTNGEMRIATITLVEIDGKVSVCLSSNAEPEESWTAADRIGSEILSLLKAVVMQAEHERKGGAA